MHRHRIDAATFYCTPATGPHGFHTLGRVVESSLRSYNNLLERLHASYFFYLFPRPGKFIPVGNYLPSAVLIGASITLGGFDCPDPLQGLIYLLPGYALALLCWVTQMPVLALLAFPWVFVMVSDKHTSKCRSTRSLVRLLYGALVPTLAMVNFPQAILLAWIVLVVQSVFKSRMHLIVGVLLGLGIDTWRVHGRLQEAQAEWTLGNVTYPAAYAVLIPLFSAAWCFSV